jgi:hypothetical protein
MAHLIVNKSCFGIGQVIIIYLKKKKKKKEGMLKV